MYIDEFNKLWDKQATFYLDLMGKEEKERVFDTIFFQRRLKSQKGTVATCTFEPNKKGSPISSPTFQKFRIIEQCSRLRITDKERYNDPLTEDEWNKLVTELNGRETLKFDRMKTILGLADDAHINLENQEKLKGNTTNAKLSRVFGKKHWFSMSDKEKHEIWHTLHFYNDPQDEPDWLERYAKEKWDLDNKAIEKLNKLSLELGYARLSHKAMTKIIPYLEKRVMSDGEPMTYDKAVKKAGYEKGKPVLRKKLPEPENLRNPIVQQALFEVRRLVNAIIEQYDRPDIVRIELARELRLPKRIRERILFENRHRERKANEVKELLKSELDFLDTSREDVIKYLLWEECGKTCPYTGKKIALSSLYSGEYEIEHIIPYSRSLDDSQYNKTLCYRDENHDIKHNKTPYEAYSGDPQKYNEILDRVKSNMRHKLRLFIMKKVPDDFVSRQLVDTAYISREMRHYLGNICEKVQTTKGMTTATLRYLWGLNAILSGTVDIKQRDDHRHHAVDALVVANTTYGFVQTMSRYHKYDREPGREKFPFPWKTFREDAFNAVSNVLVSYKVNKRARGKLHEETNYGLITNPDGTKSYVVRKPVENLTPKQISLIVDKTVKNKIIGRIKSMGVDTTKKFDIPKETFNEPVYMPDTDIPIKSVRVRVPTEKMKQLYPDRKLFVEYGSNHHVEIFENKDGKRIGRFVSMFEAVERQKSGILIIDKTPPEDYQFIMSLAINELILLDVEAELIDWLNPPQADILSGQLFRIQKMSVTGTITLRHHTAVLTGEGAPGVERRSPNTLEGIKVTIDSIGNLKPVYD